MRILAPTAVAALALAAAGAAPALAATLEVAAERDPDSLDPARAYETESWQVLVNAGEGLVAYRRAAGVAGAEVVPALAASMPVVADAGRRLVFTLRADARFGPPADRPVRASDVKASLERLFAAGSPGRGLFRSIRGSGAMESSTASVLAGVSADDATGEVTVRLTRSDPAILRALALPFAFVVPRGTPVADQSEEEVASAGPYRIASYVPGDTIELRANPDYAPGDAGPATPGPETIHVRIGMGADAAARAMAAGEIDASQARPTPAQARAAAIDPRLRVHRHAEGTTYYFFMNTRRPPFDDVRVRRAVRLALDRDALARAFDGDAVPTAQVLPPGVPGRRAIDPAPAPDPVAARALVARAGAIGAPVAVWGSTRDPAPRVTAALVRTLARIGLRPTLRLWERRSLLAALADPAAPSQIGYARWRQDYPDGADWYPLLLAGTAIRTGANLNYALLDDPALDALIARAAAEWDPATRASLWRAVDRAVAARAPWAPFANSLRTEITSARVGGYVAHQLYGFLWMRARIGLTPTTAS